MRTVKFTGTVTLICMDGDGNADPITVAETTTLMAVGAGFRLDVDPDRAPETWIIADVTPDAASIETGEHTTLIVAAPEPPADPAPQA